MDGEYYVYALVDPRKNHEPFYIGKGCKDRCTRHMANDKSNEKDTNTFKKNVIAAIRAVGLEPQVIFLETYLDEQTAYDVETKYIQLYGRRGIDPEGILTNRLLEGRAPSRKGIRHSLETRQKMSERKKGKTHSEQHCENIRLALMGHPVSEEQKEKQRQKMQGRQMSEEQKDLRRTMQTGKTRGEYSNATRPAEVRAKRREADRRRKEAKRLAAALTQG